MSHTLESNSYYIRRNGRCGIPCGRTLICFATDFLLPILDIKVLCCSGAPPLRLYIYYIIYQHSSSFLPSLKHTKHIFQQYIKKIILFYRKNDSKIYDPKRFCHNYTPDCNQFQCRSLRKKHFDPLYFVKEFVQCYQEI